MNEQYYGKEPPKTLKQIFIEQLTSEGISWEAILILEGQMLPLFKVINKKWLKQQEKHLKYHRYPHFGTECITAPVEALED